MPDGYIVSPTLVPGSTSDYSELKRIIKNAGLLERQPWYYTWKVLSLLFMAAMSVTVLIFVKPFALQLLNAIFMAFVTTQIGLMAHDAGHRQIFRRARHNDIVGLI